MSAGRVVWRAVVGCKVVSAGIGLVFGQVRWYLLVG